MMIKEMLAEVYTPEMCFDLFIHKGCRYLIYSTYKGHHEPVGGVENLNQAFAMMVQSARLETTSWCFELEQDRVNTSPIIMYYWS